jgi:hypothetical protein
MVSFVAFRPGLPPPIREGRLTAMSLAHRRALAPEWMLEPPPITSLFRSSFPRFDHSLGELRIRIPPVEDCLSVQSRRRRSYLIGASFSELREYKSCPPIEIHRAILIRRADPSRAARSRARGICQVWRKLRKSKLSYRRNPPCNRPCNRTR